MEPKTPGEQSVSKGYLGSVVGSHSCCRDQAGKALGPVFQVVFGIADYLRFARGA